MERSMIRGTLLVAAALAGIGCESPFIDYHAKKAPANAKPADAKSADAKPADAKKPETVAVAKKVEPAIEYSEATGKDERLYVFVTAKARAHFDKHGEFPTDKFITRIAYGAKGETVRFENDAAVAEYDRKHTKG